MNVSALIDQLEQLPRDAQVVLELENIDNLPLRLISQIYLWQGSDGAIDPNEVKYQDQVRIKTATAHLHAVEFETLETTIPTPRGFVYHNPRRIIEPCAETQHLITVYDANRDQDPHDPHSSLYIVASAISPASVDQAWDDYIESLKQPIAETQLITNEVLHCLYGFCRDYGHVQNADEFPEWEQVSKARDEGRIIAKDNQTHGYIQILGKDACLMKYEMER